MSAISFFQELQNYLRVSHRVVSRTGSQINVGEEFTVRITVTNTAPSHNASGGARIHFREPEIRVRGTGYARPVDGNIITVAVDDPVLTEGDSGRVDIRMTALADLPEPADWFNNEPIAQVSARATFDLDAFVRIHGRETTLVEELHPG